MGRSRRPSGSGDGPSLGFSGCRKLIGASSQGIKIHAQLDKGPRRRSVTNIEQRAKQMRPRNVPLAEPLCVTQRLLEHPLRPWREQDMTVGLPLAPPLRLPNPISRACQADTNLAECRASRGVIVQQAQQQVFRADVIVAEHAALLLGIDDDAPRVVSESLEHKTSRHMRHSRYAPVAARSALQPNEWLRTALDTVRSPAITLLGSDTGPDQVSSPTEAPNRVMMRCPNFGSTQKTTRNC